MCRYRYYYYASCRHQQTVLFDYCEHGVHDAPEPAPYALATVNETNEGTSSPAAQSSAGTGGARTKAEEGTAAEQDGIPSLCTYTSHSTSTSLDKGSASVTAEPDVDSCSSLDRADPPSPHSSSAAPSHGMAGLPLFGFRPWLTAVSATVPKHSSVDAVDHGFMSNKQPVGAASNSGSTIQHERAEHVIQQHSNNSSGQSKNNDIVQHVAESCRKRDVHHVAISNQRSTSAGSIIAGPHVDEELEATQNAYDNIEAEIDQLKEEVLKLREEAQNGRTTAKTDEEVAIEKYLSSRSLPQGQGTQQPAEESAAARLQRLHEALKSGNKDPRHERQSLQALPSPMDFPALGSAKSTSTAASSVYSEDASRRPSYANAATAGMLDAIDHAFSPTVAERKNSKVSDTASDGQHSATSVLSRVQTCSTAATQDSHLTRDEDQSVIIMSERVGSESPVIVSKGSPSPPNTKPVKQAPHFAQPTKSFASRAGEALRKEAALVSPKSSPASSPTKPVKAREPSLATTKRAAHHQQKRKPLPGDWLNSSPDQYSHPRNELSLDGSTAVARSVELMSSPTTGSSRDSTDEWQIVDKPPMSEKPAGKSKAKNVKSPPEVRKKPSSYMAPTSAAAQRTLVTIGQEKIKRLHCSTKTAGLRIDTALVVRDASPSSPQPNTASSANSSVQFIVDRTNSDTVDTPHTPASKGERSPASVQQGLSGRNAPIPIWARRAGQPGSSDRRNQTNIPRPSPRPKQNTRKSVTPEDVRSADSCAPLPQIANTTTKRRTSHGHLLTPIVARLDSEGLLNRSAPNSALVEAYVQSTANESLSNALNSAREKPPQRRSEARSDVSGNSEGSAQVRKVLPPHLRGSREASAASASTDATLCPGPNMKMGDNSTSRSAQGDSLPRPDAQEIATAPLIPQPDNRLPMKLSPSSSLRATASEFMPVKSISQDIVWMYPSWQDPLAFRSSEEWSSMSPEARHQVQTLRGLQSAKGWAPSGTVPPPYPQLATRTSASSHRFTDTPGNQAHNATHSQASATQDESATLPQAGQVLRPYSSPGQPMEWTLESPDGQATATRFGRAPPPPSVLHHSPEMSSISPTSVDTSPFRSPLSLRRWQIGSAFSHNPYGWTGGDGKEIRFRGYGPHAEADPYSVVNFDYQGRTSSFSMPRVPYGMDGEKENIPTPEQGIAPRSQRQWAEKLAAQTAPCGSIEIMDAVEQLPFGTQLSGYCHDCAAR